VLALIIYGTNVLLVKALTEFLCKCLSYVKDIRTFEVLLRTYEVREEKLENTQRNGDGSNGSLPCKRRQCSDGGNVISSPISSVMARPCGEARGHTGYLTFARLRCLI